MCHQLPCHALESIKIISHDVTMMTLASPAGTEQLKVIQGHLGLVPLSNGFVIFRMGMIRVVCFIDRVFLSLSLNFITTG